MVERDRLENALRTIDDYERRDEWMIPADAAITVAAAYREKTNEGALRTELDRKNAVINVARERLDFARAALDVKE